MLGVDVGGDLLHHFGKGGVGAHLGLHLVQRVQYGGVIPMSELLTDVVKGQIGHAADQIHGDLTGIDDVASPVLTAQGILIHVVILADIVDDVVGLGHILVVCLEHVPHHPVHGIFIHLRA